MPRIKMSDKKMNHALHGRKGKKIAQGKIVIHGEKNVAGTIIAATINKTNSPTIQVSKQITEVQRRRLERSGIKIVTVDDMVKRREENLATFRKMGKPGYVFSSSILGELK